jgi:HEAT repeat protein
MTDTTPDTSPDSGRKLFFGLFIFPLLIAVGMAVLLCTVVLMTHEKQTPESLIADLKKSAPSKRWQKAFELSNEINRDPKKVRDPGVYREMIEVLKDSERFDARTRGYMAIALAHEPSSESAAALENSLSDPAEEVRVYSMWAIGSGRRKASAGKVAPLLDDDSPEVRKTAAYVLGALEDSSSAGALREKLSDPVMDVRWNAALALSRIGSADGYETLLSMLDRERLETEMGMDEKAIESAMVNAMKGLVLIPRPDSVKILESISKQDKNLRVRQASMDSVEILKKSSG